MKKNMWTIIAVFILFAGMGFQPLSGFEQIRISVTADEASVRLDPNAEAPVVEKLNRGKVIIALEKTGEWFRVELPEDEQGYARMGYIHQSQVEVINTEKEKAEKPEPETIPRKRVPRQPAAPPAAPRGMEKTNRLYVSGTLGFGFGFSSIKVGTKSYKDGDREDVNIQPGGGGNLRAAVGYRIMDSLKLELGVGFQTSGDSFKNGSTSFSRFPMSVEIKYLFSSNSFQIFAGAGPVVFLGPNFDWKYDDGKDYYIKYNSPFGILAEIGGTTEEMGKSMYLFGSVGYMGALGEYEYQDANFFPISKLRNMSAHGIFLNFGIGYYLN